MSEYFYREILIPELMWNHHELLWFMWFEC